LWCPRSLLLGVQPAVRCALLSALLACGRAARRLSRGRRKLSRLALNRCQISLCKYPAGDASGAKPLA
jgi:hypothetical protein